MQAIRESMQPDPGNRYVPFAIESRHFDGALAELQLKAGA
jgi:hypothetical protein